MCMYCIIKYLTSTLWYSREQKKSCTKLLFGLTGISSLFGFNRWHKQHSRKYSQMSTFSGFLDGIDENVSVDRFTEFNLRSKVFFLSHCHMDHMIGLKDITPESPLPGPLYLSEVSQIIIQRRYPAITNLIPLKLGETIPVTFETDNCNGLAKCEPTRLSVTAIPAGHCPGSIMLLFEKNDKRILYTGDFRLYREDIEGIIALKKFHEKIPLDYLYLDSTFLSVDYMHFPRQRESIQAIIRLTEKWLAKHDKNIVLLRPPAAYGYEFLLQQLSQHFGVKIHVTNATFKDYLHIPQFDMYMSNNRFRCGRIHLCSTNPMKWQSKECPCLQTKLNEKHICIIRPTAMKWRRLTATDTCFEEHNEKTNVYNVCYSNHASLGEIEFFVRYLQPKAIKLNVVPKNVKQIQKMYDILHEMTKDMEGSANGAEATETATSTTKTIKMDVKDAQADNAYQFNHITANTKKRTMSSTVDEISQLKFRKRPKISNTKL